MIVQTTLFVDSIEEALRDAIGSLKGMKAVAETLWPEMAADLGAKRLNHCLDPERPEKLELSQVMLIAKMARRRNCHTLMAYMAEELGYSYQPITPQDKLAELQRQFVASVEAHAGITAELKETLADVKATVSQFPGRRVA